MTDDSLSSHAHEMDFAPDPAFTAQANGTAAMYDAAAEDHEGFWAEQARSRITWAKDFERTLDWDDAPFAKWFVGGELNVAVQLRRPARRGRPRRPGRDPLGGRARRHPHHHLRRAPGRGLPGRQRAHRARRAAPATGSRSTCR